jgi:SOS-response transcriptional repressor LexA
MSKAIATRWKNGSIPRDTTLLQIADYFGVTVDYLIGKESDAPIKSDEAVELERTNIRWIPIFETVSAGFGAYASNDIQDYMPVYFHNPSEASQTICIKVRGDSMHPKIEDGDIIQVHKHDSVDSGAIAVVLVDGDDGLVKRLIYGNDWIELHSINPMYAPMRFEAADMERIRVVGMVTQVTKGINGRKAHSVKAEQNRASAIMDNLKKMNADELRLFNQIYTEYMRKKQ